MNEAQWQGRITDLCDLLGLKWHHETDSRRSKSGFPDLVICGCYGVIFAELKTEKGRVSQEQQDWLDALYFGETDYTTVWSYIWRPSDWPEVYAELYRLAGKKPPPHNGVSRRNS
jgi:hypothetical protein